MTRAGMVTTLVEPFLSMVLQRAVHRLGSQPATRVTGVVAPIDFHLFKAIHHMLVSSFLPIPRAGQGISMSRHGGPVQKTGSRGGRITWGFEVTVAEVVTSLTLERCWAQRVNALPASQTHKVSSGPVFHHSDGCIGCVACPMAFTYNPAGKYGGLTVGTLSVKHDYFVLDIAGQFHGMGVTRRRDEEAAVINRVMLCQNANRLRIRGAVFSEAQVATIDLHLNAVLRALPSVDTEAEDDTESATEEEDATEQVEEPAMHE